MKKANSIDEYIAYYPEEIQQLLQQLRQTIQKAAPKAEETISYGIPTFIFNGILVHFGAFKKHIGFFPGAAGVLNFSDELTSYKTSKGTIQFPINKPIPLQLITKVVKFRLQQNKEKKPKKMKPA